MFRCSTKLNPVRRGKYLDGPDQIRIPRVVIIFFPLFSTSFSKAILKTAELPSLCNIVSSIYKLFVPHFAMTIFMCIYLHYRTNKQRDRSFEFSLIL